MTERPPTLPPLPPPPPRPRNAWPWIVVAVIWAAVVAAWLGVEYGGGGRRHAPPASGKTAAPEPPTQAAAREADLWRLGADGLITAKSEVDFPVWPAGAESVLLILPYPEARVARVSQDGAELRWRMRALLAIVAKLKPLPPGADRGPVVVEWELPLGVLSRDARGWRARLHALLPVVAYRLDLELAPDAPWRFRGDPAATRKTLFSVEDTGGAPRLEFGSCGLGLIPRNRPVAAQ